MKKRIAILVVFLLILCLTLVGCGQRSTDDKTYDVGSTDSTEQSEQDGQDGQDAPISNTDDVDDADDFSSNTSISGIKNADGTYTHDLDGVKITLKTNISDYIHDGNVFYYDEIAEDLGWHFKDPSYEGDPNIAGRFWDDDNTYYVMFDKCNDHSYYYIYCAYTTDNAALVIFKRYDREDPDTITYQVNPNGRYNVNYEQIALMTYLLENMKDNPDFDPIYEIRPDTPGTWTIYK